MDSANEKPHNGKEIEMTREILLHGKHGEGEIALVDDEDYAVLNRWRWFVHCQRNTDLRYAYRCDRRDKKQVTLLMHREILEAHKGEIVDHINCNGLDNRRDNLRVCSHAENTRNSRSRKGTSKYKGIYQRKGSRLWTAEIQFNNKTICLGTWPSELGAAKAYDAAARYYHEEFARTNFEDGPALSAEEIKRQMIPFAANGGKTDRVVIIRKPRGGRSRFMGVDFHRNKWRARISVLGTEMHLGYFETEEEAAKAYDRAAKEHLGEAAETNFS